MLKMFQYFRSKYVPGHCHHWKNEASQRYHICQGHYEIKVTDLTDEPIVQCNVPAVTNTWLNDDDNDDQK